MKPLKFQSTYSSLPRLRSDRELISDTCWLEVTAFGSVRVPGWIESCETIVPFQFKRHVVTAAGGCGVTLPVVILPAERDNPRFQEVAGALASLLRRWGYRSITIDSKGACRAEASKRGA